MTDTFPRVIALEGASNVRDLGGYRTESGQKLRFGRVFRGAALGGLTDTDKNTLRALGIAAVCDLRGTAESAAAPSHLPGAEIHSFPIEPSVGASLRDLVAKSQATGEAVMDVMRRAYVAYALDWSHRYRSLFEVILANEGRPVLFHCSAGKDRTGFGAALLLTALGVPRETVFSDYLASNHHWRGDAALAAGLPPDTAGALLRVHRDLLEAALAAAESQEARFDGYAERQLGLNPARLDRLRTLLLE